MRKNNAKWERQLGAAVSRPPDEARKRLAIESL